MKIKRALVVDSSVAVKWLNRKNEKYTKQADKILTDVQEEKTYMIMPELAKYEIGNSLVNKQMSVRNTQNSLATYFSIPIQFIPQDQDQAENAAQIAHQNKITFYDASFMALAKEQRAILVTDNPKHQNKKVGGLKVISLKDY